MTADPKDLTDVATLKTYLKAGSESDTLLQQLLTAASYAIENYVNRTLVSDDFTDVLDGTGGRFVVVPNYPITAVSGVMVDGNIIPAGSVSTVGFYFTKNTIVLNGYSFTRGRGNVTIAYTAGFATVPPDLAQMCIGTVQHWLNDRNRAGETSRSMGGQTITYTSKDMPEWVKTGLNSYKSVCPV